tara:strand:+ start:111637 stop:114183 length:2547 start_codon:yes stop_codon:yes gene_type:complete
MTNHCTKADSSKEEIGRSVALPVLDSKQSGAPKMGRTKIGRWRAIVLIMVNVLMVAHLIQWLIMGMTVSPIEPSEAMETLEVGVINAGAIMFLLAFLSTLILGRFFCGWLCHVVALQDLCAYMMTSIGIRPKPFRSRLLIYFPFALGMYMFVWPSFKRIALAPALDSAGIDWPAWLRPVEPIHQYSSALIVDDFWATMPPWFIAVPFLFICGFAAVYFLGAKGFCTYGCPYAAFFKPLDKVAPLRIRVNDDCHQCGHCTSACTSNVRVNEEVLDFGMVVDAGCMKTLDCVSACPNDALSLGFGKVALGAKPTSPETYEKSKAKKARRYDMSLKQELLAAVLMLWFFFATRGMLDAVPMLMAGGLAAIAVMLVMTSIKILSTPNARLYSLTLKNQNKIKPWGMVVILLALVMIVGSAWSGTARANRWRGDVLFAGSEVPATILLREEFMASPEQASKARKAVSAYQRADSIAHGGFGWKLNPEHRLRMSYFLTMLGRFDESVEQMMLVIDEGNPTDEFVMQLSQLKMRAIAANPPADVDDSMMNIYTSDQRVAIYAYALQRHPNLHGIRNEIARSAYARGDMAIARAYWDIDTYDDDPYYYLAMGAYAGFTGQIEAAQIALRESSRLALSELDRPAEMLINIANTSMNFQLRDLALDLAQQAVDHPSADGLTWLSAGEVANAFGRLELGRERAYKALELPRADRSLVMARAAGVIIREGDTDQARELLTQAAAKSDDPFEVLYIAKGMITGGSAMSDMELVTRGVDFIGQITSEHPDIPFFGYEYGQALYSVGRTEESLAELTRVAESDIRNPVMASRVALLHQMLGNEAQYEAWTNEANKRQMALDSQ